ncbi:hypothetical protein BKP35_18630 [Anaerobacillus arseniciselenatis]|uniref:nitrite reductase (cytochrome; ammonia-forming) n=1 Tax=Anaerobacillus arseniciselenatis TaxID=85682 RepID=A0A1S2L7Y5_9BACI|nr:ammonia-forming cytochrome c nitrite reductase subunit c552 [Anaerobacillus arseniciselenatis]OIJ07695.1 hypothetical protein BKP35_18630 [Anaerobacillus arseniciselenatis]
MLKKHLLFLAVILLAFALVITGCSTEEETTTEPTDADTSQPDAGSDEGSDEASDEPAQFTGFSSIEEAANSDNWAPYFPAQYATWTQTKELQTTTYGGALDDNGELQDYLTIYPFLVTNYAGFPFSVDYNRSRGHMYALTSVNETQRLPDWENQRRAACLSCKSTDVVVGMEKYGDDFWGKPYADVVGENTIGCLDCHDQNDGSSLNVPRDYVYEALDHGGYTNDPRDRADLTCAQCHVNYHFDAETTKITFPWSTGMTVEAQLEHYNAEIRSDEWEHEITGALIAKIQHPEYELYYEGKELSVHAQMGVGCNDCHMPTFTDENGEEFTSHQKMSPLLHVEESCLSCHGGTSADELVARTEGVQKDVYEKQNRIGYDLEEFINQVGAKIEDGSLAGAELEEIQAIHREAQFYWDYVWVENSNGFHNAPEAHRILDNADALIQQGMELLN